MTYIEDGSSRAAYMRAWNAANPEKVKASNARRSAKRVLFNKEWRLANPEKYAEHLRLHREKRRANRALYNAKRRAWYKDNPEVVRAYQERTKVSRTKQTVEARRRKRLALANRPQPNKCEICHKSGVICFDHCHISGKFRGWLCYSCNAGLGMAKDDIKILKAMIRYLENFKEI